MSPAFDDASSTTLAFALEASGMGTWRWDLASGAVRWSPRVEVLFGLPSGTFGGTLAAFLDLVEADDRPGLEARIATALATGADYDTEFRVTWPDGSCRWLEAKGRVERDAAGAARGMIGTIFDVTARKRAEDDARRAEELFRGIVEDQTELIVRWTPDGTRTFVNGAYARFHGVRGEALVGTSFFDELAPDQVTAVRAQSARLTPESPVALRLHASPRDGGRHHWHEWTNRGRFDAHGTLVEIQSVGRDITAQVESEAALRKANRAYRILSRATRAIARGQDEAIMLREVCDVIVGEAGFRLAWVGLVRPNGDGGFVVAASSGEPSDFPGEDARASVDDDPGGGLTGSAIRTGRPVVVRDPADRLLLCRHGARGEAPGFASGLALPLRRGGAGATDERVIGALTICSAEPDAFDETEVALFVELADELTFGMEVLRTRADHRRAEQELVANEAVLRLFIRHTPAAVAMVDNDMRYLHASERWITDYGLHGEDIIGRSHYEVFPDIPEHWKEIHRRCLAGVVQRCEEDPFERASGTTEWLKWEVRPWHRADGAIGGMIMLTEVITERTRAEAEHAAAEARLRESEERLRQVAENLREVVWLRDAGSGRVLYVSPAFEHIWGRSCADLLADEATWSEGVHPDDRARVVEAARTRQATGDYDEEYRVVRPEGSVRWVHARAFPVRDASGRVTRVVGVTEDITERRAIELHLQQRQRLEAVGQLAGGIAHDFNNILLVILMELDLILGSGEATPSVAASAREIKASAERAAHLTRQLLQFSRRQVMRFTPVDLNKVVADLATMLQRVVREDVHIALALAPGALMTMADAGMLEQVLVNLAVNARDAMPQGGVIHITTGVRALAAAELPDPSEVPPGDYVWLSVADVGVGISTEDLPRIFEPFFTTKEQGKGTGLGLATVFGIVKQHRGVVTVRSTPGRGSVFDVLLPALSGARAEATIRAGAAASDTSAPAAPRLETASGPLILVVEDDPAVRRLTLRVLEQHGYRTLGASDAEEALALWERHGEGVRLVVSDVVMPGGMSGHDLARELRARGASAKVLLTSGYDLELARGGELAPGEALLSKPYRPDDLLRAVARALGG
ncbi:MAG: PAS domain S-box protein [Deltaproteobacteria bacterium]|nr:PAS domain S-box protein [Deltaproteobacteria bacterium]